MDWLNNPTPYTGSGSVSDGIPDLVQLSDIPTPAGSGVTLGIGSAGPVTVDLDDESPHILVNAPTGEGKSTVARSVAVQRLSLGDGVVFLDAKRHSHQWARDMAPLVHYADTHASIGSSLINLGYELHRRNQVLASVPFGQPVPEFDRIVVVFEETNATLSALKEMDKQLCPGSYKALDAFRDQVFMGRAVRMHVVAFAQLATYRSGLTADILENFGTKVLIQASEKAWKWLVPECGRYRAASQVKGRAMVCRGSSAKETQLTLVDEVSSREHVLAALPAQRKARELSGGIRNLSPVWRQAIGR